MSSKIIYCAVCGKQFHRGKTARKKCHDCYPPLTEEQMAELNKEKVIKSHQKYTDENKDEWVECEICGFRGKDLGTHFTKVHKLKPGHGHPTKPKVAIDRMKGPANPWAAHGGKMSPFSRNFIGYKTEEEYKDGLKAVHEKSLLTIEKNNSLDTRLCYYTARGMSEDEAKAALKERQTTFSLEKCIEKLGEEEGTKRWLARQEKWQTTLNNLPEEEKKRIAALKMTNSGCSISKAEKELFKTLSETFPELVSQLVLSADIDSSSNRWFVYDINLGNKIIEYNGDYWHANPSKYSSDWFNPKTKLTAKETWLKDKVKIEMANNNGYEVLVIWENDYKTDKEKEIQKCISFLSS